METTRFLVSLALFIVMASLTIYASDPNMLQDFCVATKDPNDSIFVNGILCKNPTEVTADDFFFRGLNVSGDTNNKYGVSGTPVAPSNLPGLNTMGISMARIDYAPNGFLTPHINARATEIVTLLEGTLYVGFVSGANKLYSVVLNPGDVFVFPQGLVHFHFNVGDTNALSILGFSSQNPGTVQIANGVFGSQPPISVDVLSKAFQLDAKIVEDLQSKFA